MADFDEVILGLIRDAVPGIEVYDGLPALALEDRPSLHVIVDLTIPTLLDSDVAVSLTEQLVRFQVRVISRSSVNTSREDAAWRARWHAIKIRDRLCHSSITPSKGLVKQTHQTGFTEDQALVSHAYRVEVGTYEARI